MGLIDRLLNRHPEDGLTKIDVDDEAIVAVADGEMVDIKTVPDPMFADELMGKSVAFKYDKDKVILCSPCNGTLTALFPTGHAFGVTGNNGVEILVHCGVDTVNAKGDGFRLLKKRQGDHVDAGDPIVEADIARLSQKYDMSTILIITNPNDRKIDFIDLQKVKRGQSLIR